MTNAMVDSGATEDFIDQQFFIAHQFLVLILNQAKDIFVIGGKSGSVGPITHEAVIAMEIESHREQIRFHVANLKKPKAILGVPWPKGHNYTIDWDKKQIPFNSEKYTEICLKDQPVVKGIPEEETMRENSKTKVLNIHLDKIHVPKSTPDAKIPRKGSEGTAGRDLYANENSIVPPRGRRLIGFGI